MTWSVQAASHDPWTLVIISTEFSINYFEFIVQNVTLVTLELFVIIWGCLHSWRNFFNFIRIASLDFFVK